MDYRMFELVSYPFTESQKRALEGRTMEDGGLHQAYEKLISFGEQLAESHVPDKLRGMYGLLQSAMQQSNNKLLVATKAPLRVPPLYMNVVDDFVSRVVNLPADDLRRLSIALFCAIYFECSEERLSDINFMTSAYGAALHADLASYAAWKAFADVKSASDRDLTKAISEAEERLHSVVGDGQMHVQEMIGRSLELQKLDATLRAQIQQTIGGVQSDIAQLSESAAATQVVFAKVIEQSKQNEERISLSRENIQRYSDAIREELRIDSTKKLWQQRATEGTNAFRVSAIAIAVLLVGPIYYAFSHLEALIKTLQLIGDAATSGIPTGVGETAAHAVARLAVITVPLAIYFWAVKLLVRYNARSMMLMDDAQQRQTMMEVYTHLIENQGATPEERALVLNALFRPAPGHGPENVEPPNFTELLSKASPK